MEAQVNFSNQSRLENWPVTNGSTDKFVIPAPSVQACKFWIPETWWWIGDIAESLESVDYFWPFSELCTRLGCRLSTAILKKLLWLFNSITACAMYIAKQVSTQRRLWSIHSFLFTIIPARMHRALIKRGLDLYHDWSWREKWSNWVAFACRMIGIDQSVADILWEAMIKGSRLGMCVGTDASADDILFEE